MLYIILGHNDIVIEYLWVLLGPIFIVEPHRLSIVGLFPNHISPTILAKVLVRPMIYWHVC